MLTKEKKEELAAAHKLAFTHPRTKRKRTFTAPWPADFQEALERLRAPGG